MKVVNLCVDDWANFQHGLTLSLRSVGVDAEGYKLNRHLSGYASQDTIADAEQMKRHASRADVVNIVHSNENLFRRLLPALRGKTINVFYTGTVYRRDPAKYNAIFNPYVNRSFIALGEFDGMGAKNQTYIVGAVDTSEEPVIRRRRPIVFGHYPSNPTVKGTDDIVRMAEAVINGDGLARFEYSREFVGEAEQRRRLLSCDVYLELYKPILEGKKYGSFGMTALEVAAMGKAVITQNLSKRVYEESYGYCPLLLPDTREEFVASVISLQFSSDEYLERLRRETRRWVVDNHSLEATGRRLANLIL